MGAERGDVRGEGGSYDVKIRGIAVLRGGYFAVALEKLNQVVIYGPDDKRVLDIHVDRPVALYYDEEKSRLFVSSRGEKSSDTLVEGRILASKKSGASAHFRPGKERPKGPCIVRAELKYVANLDEPENVSLSADASESIEVEGVYEVSDMVHPAGMVVHGSSLFVLEQKHGYLIELDYLSGAHIKYLATDL